MSKRQRNKILNCQHSLNHGESKGILEKHLLHLLHYSLWLHGSQQTGEFFFFPPMFLFYFIRLTNHFNWRIFTLQYCDSFCHTSTWISHGYICVSPSWTPLPRLSPPHSFGLSQSTGFGCPASCMNLHWSSILHMVIYIFRCYSLKSSHPHLLPQNPKVCPLHLCLFCWLAYRVIVTVFLNSIYMR